MISDKNKACKMNFEKLVLTNQNLLNYYIINFNELRFRDNSITD